MKLVLSAFVITFSLLIIQCSNEIPTSNDPINLELGKISLRFDKVNAPSNVVIVEAFLTRVNHDTLYGSLDILSSTSADITFEDVAAGEWHLKVDAKDSSGVVIYAGETDINILAGVLTQVNLTLVPTGFGTGSIYIYVTWGQGQNQGWIDFPGNPVLTKRNIYYENFGVSEPAIIYENNLYKMWYVGDAGSAVHYVMYAESQDGINWTHPYSGPVLSPGPLGTWDSHSVVPGAVIKEDGIYKMYYSGWSDKNAPWHVGLATSIDGIIWIKNQNPVFIGGTGGDFQIKATSIVKNDNTYLMYYLEGYFAQSWSINLATSTDGLNWTKYSGNPILTTTNTWEGIGVLSPSIMKENDTFRMVYQAMNNSGFGLATSQDGMNWTPSPSNPFFTNENTVNLWGETDIAYPVFVRTSENDLRIYYCGIPDNSGIFKIGFMKRIP